MTKGTAGGAETGSEYEQGERGQTSNKLTVFFIFIYKIIIP